MAVKYTYELMDDPKELAAFNFCHEETYRDLLACQQGNMSREEFKSKYLTKAAVLCLDMTGFTKAAMERGSLESFFRILNVQRVCCPVFRQFKTRHIHAFADNITVIFDDPDETLAAAFEVHRRIKIFNRSDMSGEDSASCCIGIGYGDVYAIGIDQAMGDEMNRAAKLGEDIARDFETLLTERAYDALHERDDGLFRKRTHEAVPFAFYKALS
ncbi:MAG: hypothetical protein JRG97_12575 [Deltaproteobacteria bacterium]|nr:hypothetical protein [Deltaproteobacteria bacterium]MBW2051900.1 hypothetical protein [Deltaproteobacteria bacterium]MBW2141882.1 hypothetical protein [Deltaproteobacteria bacterium]MBW2323297.1 hypothetical protein [Deltaproteobacteria bacterium]